MSLIDIAWHAVAAVGGAVVGFMCALRQHRERAFARQRSAPFDREVRVSFIGGSAPERHSIIRADGNVFTRHDLNMGWEQISLYERVK